MPHPAGRYRLLVLLFVGGALAWSTASAQDSTLSPYFVVTSDDPETDRLPLLATHVLFSVSGVIAEVTLTQTYKNDGVHPIHAKYVFPASTRAAVHGLTMQIGEHRITAKIKERERAKKEFKAAKKAGKNAALLEQQRPNVFTMNVANVMPGQEIDVELRYTELLVPTDGVYEFMTPTVVGPRYSDVPASGAASTDLWLQSPYTSEGTAPTYTFGLSGTLNAAEVSRLTPDQGEFLGKLASRLRDGMGGPEIHDLIYGLAGEMAGIKPAALFQAIYLSLLGKTRGPRAGSFISILGPAFCGARFSEAAEGVSKR